MTADILRTKFLEFFAAKGHRIVESDSLVPKDDPTVLFTPAGMNQFKKYFLGLAKDFTRAASSQRCLRTDDLDKVGKTRGHHTFFEMLGNFSFGDYFKKEAIAWAWEFLTVELKIPAERLWVSVYKDDEEAYCIWRDTVKVPESRIVRLGDKSNFWPSEAKEKGPNGPCGPCSEIFFDQGKEKGCGKDTCNPDCDCGRFLEVWNLVFTQFNRKDNGVLEPLPQKNIDTGMGLERLTAVMQGVSSNFETDLFIPLTKAVGESAAVKAQDNRGFYYAIADHLRAVVFSIYDGVLPSNESRGYIVRKLIRKSVLHLRALGIKEAFLYKLVAVVCEVMKGPYPQLVSRREDIAQVIQSEEKNFISTLDSSDSVLREKYAGLKEKADPEKAGTIAFQLYDTYGIPFELTLDWLKKEGIAIAVESFQKELNEQKTRSKVLSSMKGDVFSFNELNMQGIAKSVFTGYDRYDGQAKIIALFRDNEKVEEVGGPAQVSLVLDQTPFYPESGGQVGDTGTISTAGGACQVSDVKRSDGVIVHGVSLPEGVSLRRGDTVNAQIDEPRRLAIARNHTATHLLQAALRRVLGEHVQQQGSLVADDRFRFDFTHFKDISAEDLDRLEEVVNAFVLANYPVVKREMSLAEARSSGALAFFAEKYESRVRVISVDAISKELCGGTHLDATGQIGLFTIVQEGSISSGVRRIEAVTGTGAFERVKRQETVIADAGRLLNAPEDRIASEIQKRLAHIKELERQLGEQKFERAKSLLDACVAQADQTSSRPLVITEVFQDLSMELLRKLLDYAKQKTAQAIIALGSQQQQKAVLVLGLTPDLVKQGMSASKLIQVPARALGGSGGGRNDFAQAGGNNPENFAQAFAELRTAVAAGKV